MSARRARDEVIQQASDLQLRASLAEAEASLQAATRAEARTTCIQSSQDLAPLYPGRRC